MTAEPHRRDEAEEPLRDFLTFRLSRVQTKLNAQAHMLLQRHAGLTLAKWRILALIGAAGQTRLSDLAREASLDKGLLSRNLKAMVADDLVASTGDRTDHRVQHLTLTAAGRALFDATLPKMRARQRRLGDALTPQEHVALRSALEKLEIAANWRGDEP